MRVLVACEFSGIVRDAFLARNEDRFVIFAADILAVWHAMYDAAPEQQKPTGHLD